MPNIALLQDIKDGLAPGKDSKDAEILYIGTRHGMEKKMISGLGVKYRGIFCGKFRRYFSWKNFADIFKIPFGILQSLFILTGFRPRAIFCKGGYVSFPVAVAGWMLRIPIILHESDVIPGLANKLCARFAKTICVSFEESKKYFPARKVVFTGNPLRRELMTANAEKGRELTGFHHKDKSIILFMGGSQGADFINNLVWNHFEKLVASYRIVHICGKGKAPHQDRFRHPHYKAYEILWEGLKHIYALSDVVVTRCGAITLSELDFFGKPAILIPLGTAASRGDQIENARVFAKHHHAFVMNETDMHEKDFFDHLQKLAASGVRTNAASDAKTGKFMANDKILRLLFDA